MPEKTDHEHEFFAQNTHIDSWRHHAGPLLVRRRQPDIPGSSGSGRSDRKKRGTAWRCGQCRTQCRRTGSSLLGIVGKDEAGTAVEKLLSKSGITPYLHSAPGISTTVKLRVIGRQQQLLRLDFEKKPTRDVLEDKLQKYKTLLQTHDIIVLSDYGKGALDQVSRMIAGAKKTGKMTLIDPKGEDFSKYRGATILTPNKSELRQVVGSWKDESELTVKAQNLRESLDLEYLLLTRSEEGMSLYGATEVLHIPTVAREVFDVSGAGDTVIATLATMIGNGKPVAEAVRIANRAAGIVVGKLGTATVTSEELFSS